MATPEPEVDDVTNGEEEENFQAGMRQNAADFQAHDTDQDGKLDFNEFCALVREREMAEFSEEELRARFVALDADGSGQVDVSEYIRFSFRDALARSSTRAIDLFRQWVEGGSGEIEKKEFRRAIKSMGFDFIANDKEIDMIFNEFDTDGSGKVDYKELNKHLRQGAGSKIDPLLFAGAAGEIGTKSENRHKNKFSGAGGGGPPKTKVGSARPKAPNTPKLTTQDLIVEDLYKTLSRNAPRLEQLFKRWDTDGDGLVSRKEWAAALPMIGINTTAEMLDLLFDELDADGSGTLDIDELRSAVRGRAKRKPQATAPERVSPPRGFSKSASTGSSKPPTQEALVAARSQQPIKRAEQAPRELSEEDVVALSKKLYDALKGVDPDLRHFFTLFKSVDKDGSGRITFEELGILVRQKLGLKEKHLSQTQFLALWKKLDDNATGFIDAGELSRFMRIGPCLTSAARSAAVRLRKTETTTGHHLPRL
jgi:Ca2+-binding EF-hand superfamily protein